MQLKIIWRESLPAVIFPGTWSKPERVMIGMWGVVQSFFFLLSGVFLGLSWICVIPGSGRDWPDGLWASASWSDLWKNCTGSFFFCWDRLGNGLILASCCVPNQGGTFDCVSLFTWDGRKDGKRTLLRCYVGFWMRRWDVPCDLLSYFSMWPAVHFCCLVRDWSLSCRDIRRIITR